jgi:hypothetical protein
MVVGEAVIALAEIAVTPTRLVVADISRTATINTRSDNKIRAIRKMHTIRKNGFHLPPLEMPELLLEGFIIRAPSSPFDNIIVHVFQSSAPLNDDSNSPSTPAWTREAQTPRSAPATTRPEQRQPSANKTTNARILCHPFEYS